MSSSLTIELTSKILNIPKLELKKSRFAKSEAFFFGKNEIAHFHNDGEIDIRITRKMIAKQKLKSDPRCSTRNSSSDWLEFRFEERSDLKRVIELVEIAVREVAL